MATRTTPISQTYTTPYITVDEFKRAATGVDVSSLVVGGTQAAQDAELGSVIARASSFADTFCSSTLAAQQQVETGRTRLSREGSLRLHPQNTPMLQVVSLTWGTVPNAQTGSIDPTNIWIEDQMLVAPLAGSGSWSGNLFQYGPGGYPGSLIYYTLTYIAGYPISSVSAAATGGASSISVVDRSGFLPSMMFTIFDGQNTENAVVSSSYVPATGPGALTLSAVTSFAHSTLSVASAVPPAIKEATILLTAALIKQRGSGSIAMGGVDPTGTIGAWGAGDSDKCLAQEMLMPFRNPF